MKVAICFFGLTRSLKYTIHNIQTKILEVLSKNNIGYDIYLHTYSLDVLTNKRSGESNCTLDRNEYKLLESNRHSIQNQDEFDKTFDVKDYLKHGDPWKDNGQSLRNFIRQLNSLYQVTQLWKCKKSEYSAVIYLRPDLIYTLLDIKALLECIVCPVKLLIYTPNFHRWRGFNDRFAFGSPEAMIIYGERGNQLHQYSTNLKCHSEEYLKYYLTFHKVVHREMEMRGVRVRANGKKNEKDLQLFLEHEKNKVDNVNRETRVCARIEPIR